MAVMIPDYIHRDCLSSAESKLFERFRNELPDTYRVLHSLSLAKHAYKLRAEIDFVVVSTRGLLCIEVKGGRIRQEHGIWSFIDRYGEVNTKRESPFDQASAAMFALRKGIRNKFGIKSPQLDVIIGYSVIFPHQRFKLESPEWDLRRLIDADCIDQPLRQLVEEQFDYSASEILRAYGRICPEMSQEQRNLLLRFLRPDFDLVPSISSIIQKSHKELLRLTEEQYDVLDMINNNERTIIDGSAGTGKTLLAAEKARREARAGKRVVMICYNRFLAEHLRSVFRQDSIENLEIYTLHGYACKAIEAGGCGDKLPIDPGPKFYTDICPNLFENSLLDLHESPPYDLLIIDEGQDLRFSSYLRMLDWLIKNGLNNGNWVWFEDSQQNIFLPNGDDEADKILKRGHPARFRLTKNCRNTKPISIFNSLTTGAEAQNCLVESSLKVSPLFYKSRDHQFTLLDNIVKRLLGGGVRPSDIVILSPRKMQNSVLSIHSSVGGISLVPYSQNMPRKKSIRYSTIQKFKGLEAVVIIVTDLEELISPASRSLNYVGFSRPTSCLEVLIHEKAKEQYQKLAYEFGRRNS